MTFAEMPLCSPVKKAVQDAGYDVPTPIQQQAIPVVSQGSDLFGCAQTGTGKTAAFALPILSRLFDQGQRKGGPFALVLAPTRELAVQISDSFRDYGKHMKFRQTTIFGGVNMGPQIQSCRRGTDLVVATPGRLLDLIRQGVLRLNNVETFVLDEADRMLDMGFLPDIKRITEMLPENRQTLLFSATLPSEIKKLVGKLLVDPVHISVTPESSATETVEQLLYLVNKETKKQLLNHLISNDHTDSVLVFTRTKRGADRVVKDLATAGHRAAAIHGDKSQHARQRALNDFKQQRTRVLVATDVASRGIDINQLPVVINYDVPETAESYVHRIGRTGRAGHSGTAITIATSSERGSVRDIERLIRMKINRADTPNFRQ